MPYSRTLCAGSLAAALLALACNKSESASTPSRASQDIEVSVTADEFVASAEKIKVGVPVTLRVTRKVDVTCATDIVIKDYGVKRALPKDEVVNVTFTPTKAGPIRYACAMDMLAGQLVAE